LKADVRANKILKNGLSRMDSVGSFASEEEGEVLDCGEGLSVSVDPLDGSSNLPTNNIVGSIVGVYDGELPAAGRDLVAGLYVVYGPIITVTVAREGAVHEYALEESTDGSEVDVHRTHEEVCLPDPKIFGFGGPEDGYDASVRQVVGTFRDELKLRYSGALVGDANQVLHQGGIYGYPGYKERPEGKIRLVYEGIPVGYIFECAGGASSDGERSLMEVEPDSLHARSPVFFGNRSLVDRVEDAVGA